MSLDTYATVFYGAAFLKADVAKALFAPEGATWREAPCAYLVEALLCGLEPGDEDDCLYLGQELIGLDADHGVALLLDHEKTWWTLSLRTLREGVLEKLRRTAEVFKVAAYRPQAARDQVLDAADNLALLLAAAEFRHHKQVWRSA